MTAIGTALRRVALAGFVFLCGMSAMAPSALAESVLPKGKAAYEVIPAPDLSAPEPLYRISPGDAISVSVFQEEDLSVEKVIVDESGMIQLPLIGEVAAQGRSATELSQVIAARLAARYLRDPKVVVGVAERSQQVVAVEGQVNEPGVFPIDRTYTLLSALARAKSPTRVAKLNEVVVFRTVNGHRVGAIFDLRDIRTGKAPDPQIMGGDTVVVGFSAIKGAFRDILTMAPLFNVFTQF